MFISNVQTFILVVVWKGSGDILEERTTGNNCFEIVGTRKSHIIIGNMFSKPNLNHIHNIPYSKPDHSKCFRKSVATYVT